MNGHLTHNQGVLRSSRSRPTKLKEGNPFIVRRQTNVDFWFDDGQDKASIAFPKVFNLSFFDCSAT